METTNLACVRQRLFRLLWSATSLEQSTIKILERITLHSALPESVDVADLTDRLHETFNAYSFLTRCNGWLDLDDELNDEDDLQAHSPAQ